MSDLQLLADECVFGLLEADEARKVAGRIAEPLTREDRELARAVGRARDRMLPLDLTAPAVPPVEGAWERLEAAITPPEGFAEVVTLDAARRRGGRWRISALASMAAALLLAVGLSWQVYRSAQAPEVYVVLVDDVGEPVAVLEAFADNSVLVTPFTMGGATPAQSLELWTKPDPDGPPVSVGVLDTVTRVLLPGRTLPAPAENQLYEITIEPAGGSPTGLPTGPVYGLGNARAPVMRDG
jgi:anti-sigma-K factor RskA